MEKILKAYRDYNLRHWRKIFLCAGIPIAVVIGGLWVLDVMVLERLVWEWLFVVLYVVFAAVIVKTLVTALRTRPKRLESHLYAISEKDRNVILKEFDEEKSENGRFFLTDFLLLFTDGGGIIRYAKIGEVSVIGTAIWLASGKKAAMLKAKNKNEALEIAKKIQERIPDDIVVEEEEPDEEQIQARENDEKILREIVGISDASNDDEDTDDISEDNDSGEPEE
ncbi:MAG: hypothetical protein J1F03_04135 [Oscillospiraceae bacterium]|nr:hypothetical protein [Oscillospiraceae bacterium]